ncbi:Phosphoribosylformylglycinamidine synthase [Pedosphaera parvula Ellin514]|uniref:Phosphoribosylformylglycinamidine synthase subunit PurL n=1 Tax=Pedosphaera parvula (strain Ellin514) TaxID=320771 RepID=B9XQX7_PEDPL|nr:Phosphoribosylformylglycinamidine synthase [Pedosphaera parvula Ellin514]
MVRDGTAVLPGSDAAVIRIKTDSLPPLKPGLQETASNVEKFIALKVDCNAAYVYLDPYEGAKTVVAEVARNLACSGAVPLGSTDNLNYGNPHNQEIFWQLKESVRGLAEACRAFNAPVTGGNVSLYNQNPNGPIDPTPTVAMVGLVEKPEHITTQWFKDEGNAIILLGDIVDTSDPLLGLGGSAYLQRIHGKKTGTPPRCNLDKEKELHLGLRSLIYSGVVKSAHDCSDGGLAVALAESCISQQVARETPRLIGADIDLSSITGTRLDALLFGETQSRVIISVDKHQAGKVLGQAKILGIPAIKIGSVGGTALQIKTSGYSLSGDLRELHDLWWNSIARAMA